MLTFSMAIGLFIGRFQPFHKGHLWAVKNILKECDKVIIGIGSSQYSRTATNPFTMDERKDIIVECLKEHNIRDYAIFSVPDVHDDNEWVRHVQRIIPHFDFVYTGSPLSRKLFTESGYVIKDLPRYKNISASEIRLRMTKGLNWEEMVPCPKMLKRMNAIVKVKKFSS